MELSENKILNCLNKIPANDIYYISPKQYFLRGYEYYRSRGVAEFVWSEDKQQLTARVVGNEIYTVSFSEVNEKLKYKCNCPSWSLSTQCKHVICALLTINLLSQTALAGKSTGKSSRLFLFQGLSLAYLL